MMTTNHSKETGTLYPKANITLLLSPSASHGGMDSNTYSDSDYFEEEVSVHIPDAFKATT
jgi:hypothetical protein